MSAILVEGYEPGRKSMGRGSGESGPHVTERKFTDQPLAGVSATGRFEGYASLFGVADLGGDLVMPGAFRDSLARRGAGGVKMLWQHKPSEPLGIWEEITEDNRGLFVRGRLDLAVSKAREVQALLRTRAVDGLSIGFKTERSRRDQKSGLRRLEKLDLWEISVVTFPMLPDARVSAVKQFGTPFRPAWRDEHRALIGAIRRASAAFLQTTRL